ncbi:MAG: polysaccharide deacetylase family protein [Clostridiaceae bacterium]|nr:polysaccharide deacetylase family protein [Clostridiaceae bacterium]
MLVLNKKIFISILVVVFAISLLISINGDIIDVGAKSRLIPIYSVENEENKVAITFDCAWGADDIPVILNILKEKNVKATFFLVGEWVRRNPEETRMIAEHDHDVANHSENHYKMSALNKDKIIIEIADCSKTIESVTGKSTDLFRAPYGDYNNNVISIAKLTGHYTIQWSLDSLDWKPGISKETIIERVSGVKSGDILLFHNDTSYTDKILGEVIDKIREKGLNPVPVSELIIRDNYEIKHDGRQIKKKGN